MPKLINHIKTWNIWRKYNTNNKMHKFLVLIGFIHSPTFEITENIEAAKKKWKGEICFTHIKLEDVPGEATNV